MGQYIPDITERFPEGMNGVDLTDRYFGGFPDDGFGYDPFCFDEDYHDECLLEEAKEERDTMSDSIDKRVEKLIEMDRYIREDISDENAWLTWITLGLPDGWDKDDLLYVAEDNDIWSEHCDLFNSILKSYDNQ